jgi:hypothetical protein
MWLTKLFSVEGKFSVKFPSQSDLSLLDQEDEIAVRTLFFHSILL